MSNRETMGSGPLSGVTVLDLGQIYQGPYAGFLMAKAGADVIKIEPLAGEPARARAAIDLGAALPFEMLNANKRAITLNLKDARGRELLIELAKKADVLIENFAPGVMDRLGVGWEVLRAANPRLVYATGTGFGLSGPDRDRLAMDITVQAVSGVMSITGDPEGPPVKAGPAIADFGSGVHLFAALMVALFDRSRTGKGQLVEVSMQEAVFPTLASTLGMVYSAKGAKAMRTGNRHSGLAVAPYNVYRAKDGYVAIIVVAESHWASLMKVMGREELISDPRFLDNASRCANIDETDALVESWTSQHDKQTIYEIAMANRVPCAPVREISEVLVDPHMHERGMLEWVDHPRLGRTVLPNSPLRFHGASPVATSPCSELGGDNADVYGGLLGLNAQEIQLLSTDKVI